MAKFRVFSSIHADDFRKNPQQIQNLFEVLQDAVCDEVGLSSSHDTRQLLLYARLGCIQYADNQI